MVHDMHTRRRSTTTLQLELMSIRSHITRLHVERLLFLKGNMQSLLHRAATERTSSTVDRYICQTFNDVGVWVIIRILPAPARSQPSDNGGGGGGRFPQIPDLFRRLKISIPSGCLKETSIFKIIIIDDVMLWSKLKSTWQV